MGGRLVPWIPRPKLIPEWDGMYGASGDAHLRSEVSGAYGHIQTAVPTIGHENRHIGHEIQNAR